MHHRACVRVQARAIEEAEVQRLLQETAFASATLYGSAMEVSPAVADTDEDPELMLAIAMSMSR
jgi:hypothetical protein